MKLYEQRRKLDKKIKQYCFEYISDLNKPLVVEVGAYAGFYIKDLYKANNNLRVIAIEPSPEIMVKLKEHTEGIDISYWEYAIGTKPELYLSSKGSKSGYTTYIQSAQRSHAEVVKSVLIKSKPLSEMVGNLNIDLLSINCEGGEYELLDDNLDYLNRTKLVSIAMHTKSKQFRSDEFLKKREDIVAMLKSYGFTMVMGIKDLTFRAHVIQLWQR